MTTPRGNGNGIEETVLRTGFRRVISRKKSSRIGLGIDDGSAATETPRQGKKGMRQSSSLRKLFSRTSSDREQDLEEVGEELLKPSKKYKALQAEVFKTYTGLAITPLTTDWARNLVIFGANSVKKEVVDLNIMNVVMQENEKVLTHTAVERFFEWVPPFRDYLERYLYVEEDVLIKWIEGKVGKLTGTLRLSSRMKLRGNMRLKLQELIQVQEKFTTSLPAGERLHFATEAVKEFSERVIEYFGQLVEVLPPLVKVNFKRKDALMTRIKWVKHVTSHVGADEFLVLYTRWLSPKELLEWRTKVLLPSDFKFRAYRSWQKDMDYAHFSIAKDFQEDLDFENADDLQQQEQAKLDFQRAQIAQRQRKIAMQAQEQAGDEEYSIDESQEPLQ